MNGEEPKCEQIDNMAAVRWLSAVVILHIGDVFVNPNSARYEPNDQKQIDEEE